MTVSRKELRKRERKIIFNDDSDNRWERHPASKTKESFLESRFNRTLNTQVGSYVFCVGNGMDEPYARPKNAPFGDPEAAIVEAAHANDMEIFAGLRMNDIHESLTKLHGHEDGGLRTPLKRDHPEYCIGKAKEYPNDSFMRFAWSAFNYAIPEVREYFLDFVSRIVRLYDWDGLELDFCRHPIFFQPEEMQEGLKIMTEHVGNIRAILDEIGEERGRPLLLSVHVVDSIDACRQIGLDVEEWIKRDYIDILIPGIGYSPSTASHEEFIKLGHDNDIPVYPCINSSIFSAGNIASHNYAENMRACAHNILSEGADGIQLFNLFCLCDDPIWTPDCDPFRCLPEKDVWDLNNQLGDTKTLETRDRNYVIQESRAFPHTLAAAADPYLPRSIVENWSVPLKVNADVSGSAIELLVRITDIEADDRIVILLNDMPVKFSESVVASERRPGPLGTAGGVWFKANITAGQLVKGVNKVAIMPGNGCIGKMTMLVQDIELHVKP